MKREPELRLLNNTQKEQADDLLRFYKFVYICNKCGNCYGTDGKEKFKRCPNCESKLLRKNKETK